MNGTTGARPKTSARNRQFDLLRIAFAILVLLSHAPEIADGNRSREILSRLTRGQMSFGVLAVDGFFLLSGFLIMQSWMRTPEAWSYLRKRALRIVPGYAVAVCLSILVVGTLAPAEPHFFHLPGQRALESVLLLGSPISAAVFPGLSYPLVNGSLWTIPYEFRCYLLIMLLGVCGLLRRRRVWVALTLLLTVLSRSQTLAAHLEWHRFSAAFGTSADDFHLTAFFCVGGCFYLFRDSLVFRPALAVAATLVLLLFRVFAVHELELGFLLFGSYLMFYLAQHDFEALSRLPEFPDISYGVYLYGWPVEALLIFFLHRSPWVTFAASTFLCAGLGWWSWHFVENPMLKLKRRRGASRPSRVLHGIPIAPPMGVPGDLDLGRGMEPGV